MKKYLGILFTAIFLFSGAIEARKRVSKVQLAGVSFGPCGSSQKAPHFIQHAGDVRIRLFNPNTHKLYRDFDDRDGRNDRVRALCVPSCGAAKSAFCRGNKNSEMMDACQKGKLLVNKDCKKNKVVAEFFSYDNDRCCLVTQSYQSHLSGR